MSFHTFIRERDGWKRLRKEREFESPHLSVDRALVATPSRPEGVVWLVAHRKAVSVVAPRLADGRYLLIRQERIPVLDLLWEFPAGQIDPVEAGLPSEVSHEALLRQAEEAALRELREESGHRLAPGATLTSLGHFFPSAGVMDEVCFLYHALHVVPDPQGADYDSGEAIVACRAFSVEELREMVACGGIRDANTLAVFARLVARGEL